MRNVNGDGQEPEDKSLKLPKAATPLIKKAIDQIETEDDWVLLGEVGKQLLKLYPDFDPRTFGSRKLSDLIRKVITFELDHPKGGAMRIRIKPAGKEPRNTTSKKQTTAGGN